MILIDTSAWIDFLRGSPSSAADAVERALHGKIATCAPIRMELLAGARSEREHADLTGLLLRATRLEVAERHFDAAEQIYRACRQGGGTPRKLIDCLIAAVAMQADVSVLTADAGFTVIARHVPLKLQSHA